MYSGGEPSSSRAKGKQRDVSETTPLLGSSSSTIRPEAEQPDPNTIQRSRLLLIFLCFLAVCILSACCFALLAWSYASQVADASPDAVLHEAVIIQPPYRLDVLNITEAAGIWIRIGGKAALDAATVVRVREGDDDGFFCSLWKAIGRWGVRRIEKVSVNPSTIHVSTEHNWLADLKVEPFELPLTGQPQDISTSVLLNPTSNSSLLLEFIRHSWKFGVASMVSNIEEINISRLWFHKTLPDITAGINVTIPPLPGLPEPGRNNPLPAVSDLVTLDSFKVLVQSGHLDVQAQATVINPLPLTLKNSTIPVLPFTVSLRPYNLPVASVFTEPFSLGDPNITLNISGRLLALPSNATEPLSLFLGNYLSGVVNPVMISSPQIPSLSVEVLFPPSATEILRNITIHDMKIKPTNPMKTSGTVVARIVLPLGMDVALDVKRVLPDVFVLDESEAEGSEQKVFFGHIKPEEWLEALCVREPSEEGEGPTFTVSADIVDVPFEVLPGRQKEFRNFVSKVLFNNGGAWAGFVGSAGVKAHIEGLQIGHGNTILLPELPVHGRVRIQKSSLFGSR
ncbi:hypothetical protein C8J56DRAFT_311296 [Mycena floridula]|nr:hypothetical protein C8J56DRAFT_311296 [Mycena floridula]